MARRVASVVGTRPNIMKMAPVIRALAERPAFEHVLIHTGQHYDERMSEIFLQELGVGEPDVRLAVGAGSHVQQTARIMERLEPVLVRHAPHVVLVPGDVNSTMAAALTAAKLDMPVGHVEAGLRSFDRTMPEEINRVVTDGVAELLFTHSAEARENLLQEGAPDDCIHHVGNTMIDALVAMRDRIDATRAAASHGLDGRPYLVVTLHRPALVDGPLLGPAMEAIGDIARDIAVVFPVHPRTRHALRSIGWADRGACRIQTLEPLGYVEFLGLVSGAAAVLTDSGGLQEETTFLGIPCFTLRDNTERPVTVEHGTNQLLGLSPDRIREIPARLVATAGHVARVPPLWDGAAAERLADILEQAPLDRRCGHRYPTGVG